MKALMMVLSLLMAQLTYRFVHRERAPMSPPLPRRQTVSKSPTICDPMSPLR